VPTLPQGEIRQSFVDKIHGITDKLHSLSGHLTHDPSKTGKSLIFILFVVLVALMGVNFVSIDSL